MKNLAWHTLRKILNPPLLRLQPEGDKRCALHGAASHQLALAGWHGDEVMSQDTRRWKMRLKFSLSRTCTYPSVFSEWMLLLHFVKERYLARGTVSFGSLIQNDE